MRNETNSSIIFKIPGYFAVEDQVYAHFEKKGYKHIEDYDGVMMIYRRSEEGYFRISGGFANVNSDRKLSSRDRHVVNY